MSIKKTALNGGVRNSLKIKRLPEELATNKESYTAQILKPEPV